MRMKKLIAFLMLFVFSLLIAPSTFAYDTGPPTAEEIVVLVDVNDAVELAAEVPGITNLLERGVIVLSPGDITTMSYEATTNNKVDYALTSILHNDNLICEIIDDDNNYYSIINHKAFDKNNPVNLRWTYKGRATWF